MDSNARNGAPNICPSSTTATLTQTQIAPPPLPMFAGWGGVAAGLLSTRPIAPVFRRLKVETLSGRCRHSGNPRTSFTPLLKAFQRMSRFRRGRTGLREFNSPSGDT